MQRRALSEHETDEGKVRDVSPNQEHQLTPIKETRATLKELGPALDTYFSTAIGPVLYKFNSGGGAYDPI